jgi:integrase/recombinase XerD
MNLRRALTDYLALQRALGFKLDQAEELLRRFVAFMGKQKATTITTTLALQWAQQPHDGSSNWHARRLEAVRGFARYLVDEDPRTEIPAPGLLTRTRRRETPHIYSDQEILALMHHARLVYTTLGAATYTTMIGLLSATGMRIGEVLRLDRRDVDLDGLVILVRESKFLRTRRVPIHETTAAALRAYAEVRDRLLPCPRTQAFFAGRCGVRLGHANVCSTFHEIAAAAGVKPRGRRAPRLHDIRHTFAVRTIREWYRHGTDVEQRIPWLSTYMGHVGVSSTYWYLTATPELLALAARRLERRARVSS